MSNNSPKRHGRVSDRINANNLNKQIRSSMFDEHKKQIRRKIKPGNSKTLWDSVKIASDNEVPIIPETLQYYFENTINLSNTRIVWLNND